MTTAMTIKRVADTTGFTAATLRYYEQIGLLPEASRTPAGYRLYDERTLERLSFIARAKQLGCSLDEIGALTTAWEGGRCGPVQDQLRELVAGKIAAAQDQVADLVAFTAELEHAAASLERHRPEGACDESCGCVADPGVELDRGRHAVALTTKRAVAASTDIACTLSQESVPGRIEEWRSLLADVVRRDVIDGGMRCEFAPGVPTTELMRLVAAEQECCRFLRFAITVDGRGLGLEITAPDDARTLVASMFGAAS